VLKPPSVLSGFSIDLLTTPVPITHPKAPEKSSSIQQISIHVSSPLLLQNIPWTKFVPPFTTKLSRNRNPWSPVKILKFWNGHAPRHRKANSEFSCWQDELWPTQKSEGGKGHTSRTGSKVIPCSTTCNASPTSKGLPGIAGETDFKKTFGEYLGREEKSRNFCWSQFELALRGVEIPYFGAD
jgi:hypothetical protein